MDPFDLLNESVVRFGRDGLILGFNRESETLYGWDRTTVIGKPFPQVFGEEAEGWAERLAESDKWQGDVLRQTSKGPIQISLRWSARRDTDGSLIEIFETGRNIEDVRQLRRSAEENAFRYDNLFHAIAVAFFEIDFSGVGAELKRLRESGVTDIRAYLDAHPTFVRHLRDFEDILSVNDAAVRLFGAENAEDLTGFRSGRLWPDESLPDYVNALMAVLDEQTHFVCETRLNALDGRQIDGLFTVAWSPETRKRGIMVIGVMDLGDRNRAHAELARSESNYRNLLDVMSVGLIEHDFTDVDIQLEEYRAEGVTDLETHLLADPARTMRMLDAMHIRTVNDQALRIFGVDRHDQVPGGLRWLWPQDSYGIVARAIDGRYRRVLMPPTETRIRRRDGSVIDVALAIWAAPERLPGQPVMTALIDISDRVAAQQRLEHVRAEFAHASRIATLGELAASIAHEVSQPLSAIVSNTIIAERLLERRKASIDHQVLPMIRHTISAAKRAADIISRVRSVAAPQSGQAEPLSINDVIIEALQFVRQELVQSCVSCTPVLGAELPTVCGDRIQLQQVVVNLVLNAVQAMRDSLSQAGSITISTWAEGAWLKVRVDDVGHGISTDQLERVFDSFYTTKTGGMGIGLAVCRSIVEQHEGAIIATSLPVGARFEVSLPIGTH
ncbi:ATP-binding protein [Novosphingobium sp. P6W]|uniref:PAS domain-containing sensor histidine kinase n=1 Tax=Novosphingobium sp. P6W TaxID=1609758 RepID=UPI0005C3287C|nr:ATP-binding protein [Novosphingobium sp. P6W]KIS31317.1 hypothetical protein TQ38_17645 [Novosphingobium sp. P6W]